MKTVAKKNKREMISDAAKELKDKLKARSISESELNLSHAAHAAIRFAGGVVEFSSFDLVVFSEPDEDWLYDTLSNSQLEKVDAVHTALWLLHSDEGQGHSFGYAISFGEHPESDPTTQSEERTRAGDRYPSLDSILHGFYLGRHLKISGPGYITGVDDEGALEQLMLKACLQLLEKRQETPLRVCVVGAVLEDNLLLLANLVGAYTRQGTEIVIPIDLCVRASYYGEENKFLSHKP